MPTLAPSPPVESVGCPPRFASPSPGGRTLGAELLHVLELLVGDSPMPWQRLVADRALAVDERGRPVFREIVLTVPRQCGKTALMAAVALHRMLVWERLPQKVAWSGQSLAEPAKIWEQELWPRIQAAGLEDNSGLELKRSSHNFRLLSTVNGSVMNLLSASPKSGHGLRVELAVLDEAMAFIDDRKEQSLKPAQRTVKDAQFWVVSTAGDESSVYLRGKVEAGRKMVEEGRSVDERTAYFEWSAHRDADWTDERVWASAIPALGYTVDLATIRAEFRSMDPDEFRRAALNQWIRDEDVGAVPWEDWVAARSSVGPSEGVPVWVGVDVPPRSSGVGAVVVCAGDVLEVVASGRGLVWAAETLRRLLAYTDDVAGVVFVRGSPLDSVRVALEGLGFPVWSLGWGEIAPACERFFDAVVSRGVRVYRGPGSGVLDSAVKAADTSDRASGSWLWRARPGESVAPLYAATLAFEMARRDVETPPEPNPFAAWA